MPLSSSTAPPFSVNVGLSPCKLPITGAASALNVTLVLVLVLSALPSLTVKLTVRVAV